MMIGTTDLTGIDTEIDLVLRRLIAVNSETDTAGEKDCEAFLTSYLSDIPYFQENRELFGSYAVEEDPLHRAVCWALIKGRGASTVVLIHHYDVVGIEDFKNLREFAFQPDALAEALESIKEELNPEARADLSSGDYLFGRGSADMKAGGAIQLALLKRYSEIKELEGNILLLSLPDEEKLSAGMRAAVDLLDELKEKHGLHYVYGFNSEPHQRRIDGRGLISEGSVGKILSFVSVRGFLSHVGKVFEGFNPVHLLSEIVAETELSPLFSDWINGEAAPPPTWLNLRDRKENYDVSMPLSAGGCISILTLDSDPRNVLKLLRSSAEKSFETVIDRMNSSYTEFCRRTGRTTEKLPWKSLVMTYAELLDEAEEHGGENFRKAYTDERKSIEKRIKEGELDFIEGTFLLTEFVFHFISDLSPRVVLGFVPPYYPNVSNFLLKDLTQSQVMVADRIREFSLENFSVEYEKESYYTGISDLSYLSLKDSRGVQSELKRDMPLYGDAYSIPLEKIEALSMPCVNIGPWGKDFHKLTERVYKPDLYIQTPALLDHAIRFILEQEK
ncbi:M20/M25/M40 family metallo-hydrolase [Anoxybacterium hadale]|uniref:M20/M25/M40 family metallo-hydrolase n=1 Tax=Anoxybacterium hadale TaxID=3408580 RepID=A0ACD1AGB9_9FIRM|nr:M20/M25/M40 family metallo-hydrolase [Clostridiales bacterium]